MATTTGTITSFSATPKRSFISVATTTSSDAGKSYSLTSPDPQTLRFEIQPGDHDSSMLHLLIALRCSRRLDSCRHAY